MNETRIIGSFFKPRQKAIAKYATQTEAIQDKVLRQLVTKAGKTEWGLSHDYQNIKSYQDFQQRVPVQTYEEIKEYVDRMRHGEKNILWPGEVVWYAKSSGTTNDKSKFIPVSKEGLQTVHYAGGRDAVALYLQNNPDSRIFSGRTLILGGSHAPNYNLKNSLVGDLSAILLHETARWGMSMRAPKIETALLSDFEQKIDRIADECASQRITAFAGVPSWNLELMRRVLERTGKQNLLEVWPDMELFLHGGVEFTPYRRAYRELIPSNGMHYMVTYNASEGFFAAADDPARDDMLLMLDYGTYFEFRDGEQIVPLEGVECGKTYAMLITSDNGLWRYEIGDTVTFTSTDPYRIRFAGRTRQYINAFGEELIVENADRALVEACQKTGAVVNEYTVAPCYMSIDRQGAHEWIVEFDVEPDSVEHFAEVLDEALRAANSDYDAKRRSTIERQHLTLVERGFFLDWLKSRRKNKVPRLVPDRRIADELHERLNQAKKK